MSVTEVVQALYRMDEDILTPELIEQLLTYAPSKREVAQYAAYNGEKSLLTKPDQFALQMSRVGDYEQRLKTLLFKANFTEKANEMRENLETLRIASQELRNSEKLARILEVILAMGNYLNKGNNRVGEASGFKITFLTQLDITKTADKKSSFLHVLADVAYNRFPEVLSLSDELSSIEKATKVSIEALHEDLQKLKEGLKDASETLETIEKPSSKSDSGDQFQDVMDHFIKEASEEFESIIRLQSSTLSEFSSMVAYFGEDAEKMATNEVFEIFAEFVRNFERAHRHNLMLKRH